MFTSGREYVIKLKVFQIHRQPDILYAQHGVHLSCYASLK